MAANITSFRSDEDEAYFPNANNKHHGGGRGARTRIKLNTDHLAQLTGYSPSYFRFLCSAQAGDKRIIFTQDPMKNIKMIIDLMQRRSRI